ncbi:MAG TPA: substrate-binding domain-containing protein, partial [Virgibacillus sp.]|nr:substrate-binding domain-containing protein [Virgibacillus sp.]
ANIPLREELIIREKSLREGGREAARELMKLDNKPTALLVTDDLIALGMLTNFAQNNVKVPDDVSIISFNNVLIAEMAHPALTSVDIQVFKLGYYAGDCLIEKIKNPDEPHKRVIVPFKLVERESCK